MGGMILVYENIKTKAAEQGMTIERVSKLSGIGRKSMVEWNRHSPSADSLHAVAKVLGTTVEELLKD